MYLAKFELAPEFTKEEVWHYLEPQEGVIDAYVVEGPGAFPLLGNQYNVVIYNPAFIVQVKCIGQDSGRTGASVGGKGSCLLRASRNTRVELSHQLCVVVMHPMTCRRSKGPALKFQAGCRMAFVRLNLHVISTPRTIILRGSADLMHRSHV